MSICALLGGACERDEAPATCDSVFPMPRENKSRYHSCEFGTFTFTFTLNGHLGKTLQTAVCVEYPRSPRRVKLPEHHPGVDA
jgi:hypothetical protein